MTMDTIVKRALISTKVSGTDKMVAATVVTVGSVIASSGTVVCSSAMEGAVIGLITSTFGAGNATSVAGAAFFSFVFHVNIFIEFIV